MHFFKSIVLAVLTAQLVSAIPPDRRHERQHHQKRAPKAPSMLSDPPPWINSKGNFTNGPPGSRPCGKSTSTKTITVTQYPATPTTALVTSSSPAMTAFSLPVIQSSLEPSPTLSTLSTSTTSLLATSSQPMITSSTSVSQQPPEPLSSLSTSITSSLGPYSASPPGCLSDAFLPTNYTAIQPYFGLNVANTKPFNPVGGSPSLKTVDDWRATLELIKNTFPKTNAVRIYSTTDGAQLPLMYAIPAAQQNNMSILVGVWSGGPTTTARFEQEIEALGQVVDRYGCGSFAAVSVGNEDLNDINDPGLDANTISATKIATTDLLVDQIGRVRKMLRNKGCCNTPVTHTDTWNELTNKDNPSVNKVIQACDQAVIANIFPYWGDATVSKAWEMTAKQSTLTLETVKQYGKDLWLGETGWARSQPNNENIHGANDQHAQTYFNIVGCQVLQGDGSGFYYIDWDEDAPSQVKPSFGLFDFSGKPKDGMDLSCSGFKPEMYIKDEMPQFMGGKGISGQ